MDPMGVTFEQFLKDKYDNPNGTHHYEITKTSGDTSEVINIDPDKTSHPTPVSVSNYQYEESVQASRESNKIIKKRILISIYKRV